MMNLYPNDFNLEETTVWKFNERGSWATHSGRYRENWSPYIPRNLILRYSKKGDKILDQFCGGGTTLIEAKLLGRRAIGLDINENAVMLSNYNLNFKVKYAETIELKKGNATNLDFIEDNSIDLICTHPPYANIINYSDDIKGDLSLLDVEHFLGEFKKVVEESYRVLKNGKICALMIGDIRKNGKVVPLGFEVMNLFLKVGFRPKEIVIKEQTNLNKSDYWKNKKKFLFLAHEYIFIFEK